jgi:hypothetical protein
MPRLQTAQVAAYDFGAPIVAAEVLKFRVRENQGGRLLLVAENHGTEDLLVTVKSSKDDVTYANELGTVTVKGLTSSDFAVVINPGTDKFISVVAAGGVRGVLQVRGDNILEIVKI